MSSSSARRHRSTAPRCVAGRPDGSGARRSLTSDRRVRWLPAFVPGPTRGHAPGWPLLFRTASSPTADTFLFVITASGQCPLGTLDGPLSGADSGSSDLQALRHSRAPASNRSEHLEYHPPRAAREPSQRHGAPSHGRHPIADLRLREARHQVPDRARGIISDCLGREGG